MEKYLTQIVDCAEKRLLRFENEYRLGQIVEYDSAVGVVMGICEYAEDVVCEVGYAAFVCPSVVTMLLERISCMRTQAFTKLHEICFKM